MNRALRLVVLVLLVLSALSVPLSALADTPQDSATEPYIVTFTPNTIGADNLAASLGRNTGFRVDHSFSTVIKGFSAQLTSKQVSILQAVSQVVSVAPDLPVHIADAQTVPTGVLRIGATSNTTASIDGTGADLNIDVATLDTGVDQTHPDLNVAGGYSCISGVSNPTDPASWADDNGHGTHVAGTIAARDNSIGVVGVAPGARIWAVKVFDSKGNGAVSSVICGMNWVAQHSSTIKVVNFSGTWSGTNSANCGVSTQWWIPDDPGHQAVCNLVTKYGVPLVAAAGNDGKNASRSLPAAYPETIAVGAIADSDGQPGGKGPATWAGADDTRATFSNYGAAVTIYAPGVDINSTWMGGGYRVESGTSMATPHVTGAVALYLLNHSGTAPSQVKQALVANGEPGSWGAPYGNQPLLNVNNAAFDGSTVTPTHDVQVTSVSALNPATANVANTVTVHIANQGNQMESSLSVDLKDGSSTVSSQGSLTLSIGEGKDLSFSWTPTTTGSHTLTATVSNGDINSSMSSVVDVQAQQASQKIWVSALTVGAAGGNRLTGQVAVAGDSGPVASAIVALRMRGGSWWSGYTTTDVDVTTGADGTAAIDVTLPSSGSYTVWVTNITHGGDTYTSMRNVVWYRSVTIN